MKYAYQNSTISQILEAILEQTTFTGTSNSNIADILLSILYNTPYDEEPKSVLAELFLKLKAKIENEPFEPYDKEPKSVLAEILLSILNETEYTKPATSRIGELLLQLKEELEKYAEVTVSGAICNFNTSLVKPLVNLKAYFEATQESGTPTPQSPKAISGVSAVNVFHSKKNLFNPANILLGTFNNNVWSLPSTPATKALDMAFKPNTRYTFSGHEEQGEANKNYRLQIIYTDGTADNVWSDATTDGNDFVFTSSSVKSIAYVRLNYASYGASVTVTNFQIEVGASATEYEAYNGNAYEILFPPYSENEPYFEGLLAGTHAFVDLGSLTWTYNAESTAFVSTSLGNVIKKPETTAQAPYFISSKYKVVKRSEVVFGVSDKVITEQITGTIIISDLDYTDAQTLANSLSGQYLIYELAEAVTPTITPEQLQTLLRAFAGVYYGGYIEQDKDGHRKLVVTWGKKLLSSNDFNWRYDSTAFGYSLFYSNNNLAFVSTNITTLKWLSEIFKGTTKARNTLSDNEIGMWNVTTNSNQIAIRCDSITSLEDFINAIQDYYLYYELAEPIEIDLPDGEPIITFNGDNNIYNDSANTEVTYLTTINDNINRAVTVKRQQDRLKELEKEALKPKDEVIVEEPKPIEKELKK